jgi:hypothetical protein
MSALSDAFRSACGTPNPSVAPEKYHFSRVATQVTWDHVIVKELGAGWFMDRFLYLFGEGLKSLLPCVEAWSFAAAPNADRAVIGKNAYGALLVLEHGNDPNEVDMYVLDPLRVQYWTNPNMGFVNTFGHYLPERKVPGFLDDEVYREWLENNRVDIDLLDILAIKKPLSLGGTMTLDNFQLENIVDYYRTTGPVYAKAFKRGACD